MIGEVISIGDELTSGQRLDTNSQWLSERLGEMGIRVMYHTTVADDLAANIDVFRKATERADIVVSTGGLGPTADDLTRDALAAVVDKPLELRQEAMDHIRGLFQRRNRPMPERNIVQAMYPQGSSIVHNPEGTAPGIHLIVPKPQGEPCHVIALPGVPAEMKQMWFGSVQEVMRQLRPTGRVIRHRRFKCFGAGESQLEAMLPDMIRRGRDPQVGITVHDGTITLRITAADATPEACLARMDETVATIHRCLGSLVFGTEDDELEDAVVRLLDQQGKTLATVEWATGGLVSLWLAQVAGADRWYLEGETVTCPIGAVRALEVPQELVGAQPFGVEVAAAMARTVARRTGADIVLAIGAGPTVDENAPAPELYLAMIAEGKLTTKAVTYGYHSAIRKALVAKQALNLVRLTLLNPGAE